MSKAKTQHSIAFLESASESILQLAEVLKSQNSVALSVIRKAGSTTGKLSAAPIKTLIGNDFAWVTSHPNDLIPFITTSGQLMVKDRNHNPINVPLDVLQMSDRDFAKLIRRSIKRQKESEVERRYLNAKSEIHRLKASLKRSQLALNSNLKTFQTLDKQMKAIIRDREENARLAFKASRENNNKKRID